MASGSATARRDGNEGDLHNRNSGYANNNALGGMMHSHNMSNGEFAVPNLNTPPLSMNQNAQLPNNGRPNIPQHDGANDELSIEVLFGTFLLQLGFGIPNMATILTIQQEIDNRLETSIIEKHTEDMDDSTPSIDITAFNRTGTLVPVDSLPEEYRQLINDAKKRAVAAGALSPSYLIPQLDGDDDEVRPQRMFENNYDAFAKLTHFFIPATG